MKIMGVKSEGRTGDDSDFVTVDVEDIFYIIMWRPRRNLDKVPLFCTSEGKYVPILTLEGLQVVLKEFGFTKLDSVNLVNMNKIKYIVGNGKFFEAYFDETNFTSISTPNLYKVEHLPKRTS